MNEARHTERLALLDSPAMLSPHDCPRDRAKKLLIARVRCLAGEAIKAIGDSDEIFVRSVLIGFEGLDHLDHDHRKHDGEVLRVDGEGFQVIVHLAFASNAGAAS